MTPQEIAAGVATDIRKYGHHKGERPKVDGTCCLILAPTASQARAEINTMPWFAYKRRVIEVVGATSLAHWNDSHTTAEVLAILDQIASSPVSAVLPGGTT